MSKLALAIAAVMISACSSQKIKSDYPEVKIDKSAAFDLRLKGKHGETGLTDYHSSSSVEDFEGGQKVRDHQEILDFLVSTQVTEARENQFTVRTSTVEKDGSGSLHDYAFPEPGEQIDFIYSIEGKVLKADPFPKQSIFFLPPISLPPNEVKIGDTWTMDHTWVSSNDGLPLNLNMVTIFKDVIPCGPFGRCAELEVSGQVEMANEKLQRLVDFDSKIWGRLWFSIDRGDVIWSEVRSQDVFKTKQTEMRVLSCMVSKMRSPSGEKIASDCEPTTKMVASPNLRF